MKKTIISLTVVVLVLGNLISCKNGSVVPERFEGKIIYKMSSVFLNPDDPDSMNYQVVYAQDTMLRIESFTPIGKQIYIKHIPKNRAYILMDLFYEQLAIQTIPEEAPNAGKYIFEEMKGSKNIAGKKAKNIKVTLPETDTTIVMNYYPTISSDYTEALPGIPGLPAKYTLYTGGEYIEYEVVSIEERKVERDLFGVPSDHRVVTMDEFMEMIENASGEGE
jgi:hypothetical protein